MYNGLAKVPDFNPVNALILKGFFIETTSTSEIVH